MKVEPIAKGEVSCRNCDNFKAHKTCWHSDNACGDGVPKFVKKPSTQLCEGEEDGTTKKFTHL